MQIYRNNGGSSGVSAFEIGSDYVRVLFKGNGKVYQYSYGRAGRNHVDNMKNLALSGSGLNSYINQNVKNSFD